MTANDTLDRDSFKLVKEVYRREGIYEIQVGPSTPWPDFFDEITAVEVIATLRGWGDWKRSIRARRNGRWSTYFVK